VGTANHQLARLGQGKGPASSRRALPARSSAFKQKDSTPRGAIVWITLHRGITIRPTSAWGLGRAKTRPRCSAVEWRS